MAIAKWTDADSERALRIWSDYERCHEVAERSGQTVGIEPVTGRVWFGDSIQEVVAQRDATGSTCPLFFMRVGSDTYYRKGGRK